MQKWFWIVLLASSLCLAVGLGRAPVVYSQSPSLSQSELAIPTERQIERQSASGQLEIADGIEAFDSGRFAAAIAHWQTALAAIAPDDNPHGRDLNRAYLLSNLSAAYQQLGQFSEASLAIEESLTILQAQAEGAQTQAYWQVSARALNSEGQLLWQQGKTAAALDRWQQSEVHYRKAQELSAPVAQSGGSNLMGVVSSAPLSNLANSVGQSVGLVSAQVNQAIALQSLGFNVRAVQQLAQLEAQLNQLPRELLGSVTKEIGRAWRQVGDLDQSQSVLSSRLRAMQTEVETVGSLAASQLALELGHTLRSLSHRAVALGEVETAKAYQSQAIARYETVASTADRSENSLPLRTIAQLNWLSYLIETAQLEAARSLEPQVELSVFVPGRDRVEAYISYAHSQICMQVPDSVDCVRAEWQEMAQSGKESGLEIEATVGTEPPQWTRIAQSLAEAVRQAEDLSDPLLESYAVGELGHAYELAGQQKEAIGLTQRALGLLEGTQFQEAVYRWEWQLGRLYRSQGEDGTASYEAYQRAIAALATVRQNLSQVNPQLQFSFRDDVEPLYREFVTLLLDRQVAGQERDQRSLRLAVETIDQLQIAELENFLGCQLDQLVNISEAGIDPRAAKIYPILLPEELAIVVDIPNQPLQLRTVAVTQQTVESALRDLRQNLALPGKTPAVLTSASQLYQWLFEPIAPLLAAADQIETLVFVPDGALRNVPMGVLYDGSQYLVEKEYAIAIAPQLDLFAPRSTPQQLRVLRGGVALPQTIEGRQFPAIELVQTELEQIPAELTVAPPLLNEAFTQANIEQQLAKEKYSAIHWKTHGVFSSDPAGTFLVAYEEDITANELSALVQSARVQQAEPLELLVLSACETAKGDRRAVLGLAGIAIRAGTRSTLSTLWRADDRANTQLMDTFYQGISAGLTKAQALQQAQQSLLSIEGYPAPYYWAPYVLVGNWL